MLLGTFTYEIQISNSETVGRKYVNDNLTFGFTCVWNLAYMGKGNIEENLWTDDGEWRIRDKELY